MDAEAIARIIDTRIQHYRNHLATRGADFGTNWDYAEVVGHTVMALETLAGELGVAILLRDQGDK